jgi:hypothetical protein
LRADNRPQGIDLDVEAVNEALDRHCLTCSGLDELM